MMLGFLADRLLAVSSAFATASEKCKDAALWLLNSRRRWKERRR
ncbi:hypothetical protein [Rhizobium leguminosarum]|nr:hypothetical protein [Rhizobium leguminosarum]